MSDTQLDTQRRPGRRVLRSLGIGLGLMVAFGAGMCIAGGGSSPDGAASHVHAGAEQVWTCPMHPQVRQNSPGACPICGMDLVLVDSAEGSREDQAHNRITLSERAKLLAQVRTTKVQSMATDRREIHLLGRVEYDETRLKTVTAWTGGRIDRLLVAATGQRIRPGQVIARLYSPEVYTAHNDLLLAARQVERAAGSTDTAQRMAKAALEAARQRLRLVGVPEAEIATMEAAEAPAKHISIRTPISGTVIERVASEGTYVSAGSPLYRVADLSRVWVQLDVYEHEAPLVSVGDPVSMVITGLPQQRFEGKVAFIDPVVDPRTRVVKVRVEVVNREHLLKPGMFAEAVLHVRERQSSQVMVPATAPLFTGRRAIVYVEVAADRPTYEAREVVLGPRSGDWYPVASGLQSGDRVVTRGAFVIDADLQIRGGDSMMTAADDGSRGDEPLTAALPETMRTSLAELYGTYLELQQALAADQLESARAAAQQVAEAAVATDALVPGELRKHWTATADALEASSQQLARSGDLGQARRLFKDVSEGVMALLARYGNATDHTLRVAFCPMSFDGRGASWVQRGDAIDNSYFGPAMRRCGEFRAMVAPGAHLQRDNAGADTQDQPRRAPAAHQHGEH